jgi:hypothetical protein
LFFFDFIEFIIKCTTDRYRNGFDTPVRFQQHMPGQLDSSLMQQLRNAFTGLLLNDPVDMPITHAKLSGKQRNRNFSTEMLFHAQLIPNKKGTSHAEKY